MDAVKPRGSYRRHLCTLGLTLVAGARVLSQSVPSSSSVVANDVSRLNPISVRRVYEIHDVEQIREALRDATKSHLKVSIAGKRHSQGGQTASPNGIVLDMTSFNRILGLDQPHKILTVQSGATWEQIQDYVNPYGLAVEVQQASNIFTVGGSLSVNAHGRDPNYGPIIQTVQGFRLMKADGSVVNVSRTENRELFPLVIGGYGLFGVILDVDLDLTNDDVYEKHVQSMSYTEYLGYFLKSVRGNPEVGLGYAWPSIRKKDFLQHFVVYTFTKTKKRPAGIFDLQQEREVEFDRAALAMSRHSEVGKDVRWFLQESVADLVSTHTISRNNAMRPPIKFLAYDSPTDTDILQEYFVPVGSLVSSIEDFRKILLEGKVDLLSATIRYVPRDSESFLAYAREDCFALVLYINQPLSAQGKNDAEQWTRKLVEVALRNRGTYYLPYQQYPSREQIRLAYPMLDDFVAKKKMVDRDGIFSSSFYERYFAPQNLSPRSSIDTCF
jgi:decaprenylphospho-beta-D-ribofuranose 2-oxidase